MRGLISFILVMILLSYTHQTFTMRDSRYNGRKLTRSSSNIDSDALTNHRNQLQQEIENSKELASATAHWLTAARVNDGERGG